jgi:hypothetical protein
VGQCSAGLHKSGQPGATPGPATTGYANWHSDEVESLVPVGSSPTSVTEDPVVKRQRHLGDNQEIDGSTPSRITSPAEDMAVIDNTIRFIQMKDKPITVFLVRQFIRDVAVLGLF